MPKLLYLTAGAAGMYCGSCMQDNALAKAMTKLGWEVVLTPCYTPIRVDGEDHSIDRVFFGGINVYLQQKIPFFRFLPSFFDRWLSSPGLIKRLTAKASDTPPEFLGQMTISMLKGKDGFQRKELKLLCDWAKQDIAPDYLVLSNLLIGGCIPELKKSLNTPVYVILQGDDIFLDSLPEKYKSECIRRMSQLADQIDGFLCHSDFYRNYMSDYLQIDPAKFHVVPLGIDGAEFEAADPSKQEDDFTIGYLARIAPEKGLDKLIDAYVSLHQQNGNAENKIQGNVNLKVAGWLGDHRKEWFENHWKKIEDAGLSAKAEFCGTIDQQQKSEFLRSLDALCVPASYPEPKGIYVLEAMAAGIPVVLPHVGAFPEIIQQAGSGILYDPGTTGGLEEALLKMQSNHTGRQNMAVSGKEAIAGPRSIQTMAEEMIQVIERIASR